jgi:signal transduction histidine kinase/CheY-like chemotaxis protein
VRKRYYTRLTGKVLLAAFAGIITMYVVHVAVEHAFSEITTNFERLASPNERLNAVNRLFRNISSLNHLQQAEAASGRRSPSASFIEHANSIYPSLDSLRIMFAGDIQQIERFDEIEKRLVNRQQLFSEYLELLYRYNLNPDIRDLIKNFSNSTEPEIRDQSMKVVKLYETITTTTVTTDTIVKETSGLWKRIFGSSQIPEVTGLANTETRVDKDLVVIIDTIEILTRQDTLMPGLENSLDSLHASQLHQLTRIQNQELELINTTSSLMHEIMNIISSVEQEEFARLNSETMSVFEIAQSTIRNLNYLAVIFITISVLLVMLIVIDIFRSTKYRRQLEKAHAEARRESEAKQRFLSNMSHEIRTPLQSIYGYTEHARIHPDKTANIEAIYQSARHLLKVVNEVLDYSKITSGNITLEKKPFDPDTELKNVVAAMQPLAQQKDIGLKFESRMDRPHILSGDPFRLRQILFNLIGNAIKFTNKGEVTVTTGFTSLAKARRAVLTVIVKDTGIGIDQEQLPQLFNEFSQTSPGNYDGTGLGLSIVHRLVDLQNGDIKVESKPGEGSCFTISIPYEISDTEPDQESHTGLLNGNSQSKTVIIVDDDPLILNLSSAILEKHHVPHHTYKNGRELLGALDGASDVVIFLDMRMPGMSGMELCRRIREHGEQYRSIKILALTAQVLPNERQEILDNGFDGIIVKPFQESDILKALGQSEEQISEDSSFLNMEPLLRMTGNDSRETRLILRSIIKESSRDLRAIRKAFRKDSLEDLSLVVHRMAGRVGQAGDRSYSIMLRSMERDLQNGLDRETAKNKVDEIVRRGDSFISELKNWINALTHS